jgi:hypothetical protein
MPLTWVASASLFFLSFCYDDDKVSLPANSTVPSGTW